MPLFSSKNNKFKANPPKIRVEKVAVSRPAPKPAIPSSSSARSPLATASASSSSARPSPRPSPKPNPSSGLARRQSSHSPYPSSSDERRGTSTTSTSTADRKRKAGGSGGSSSRSGSAAVRRSPAVERVKFDKDSDAEDDEWLTLETRKRQRQATHDSRSEDLNRRLGNPRSFDGHHDDLEFVHADQLASLDNRCVPVMGAVKEDVDIQLQYPSLCPRERFQLVWAKDKIDAIDASIKVVRLVAENYLDENAAEPFTNHTTGLIRRLEKASNRNVQDLMGFKAALSEYNETLLQLVEDGVVSRNLESRHELPRHLAAFILDQIYDRTVAPHVDLLAKYENGTDFVYGELLHPFVSKMLVDDIKMSSNQVFVDLGSGVGNVVLQAALEVGCESWGCEMMDNAANLAEAQHREFAARCLMWGIKPGETHIERGDVRKNIRIHDALKRADVVLVNNKAFTAQLNDDLVRMFLDLKSGCKVISLKSFAGESSSYNVNDVGSTILDVEEHTYPEGYVSWTNAGGAYYIATRK
ncbi:[histone H3]-lysine79 N-trimethyltransferase [Geosmithia morbida]|uniref:Histone-lysine N-methyltransferase, H3 lysine-79 specific n=1 Tax=Geosmithia morbida TaxID=1094350 RepID=A0A9P5D1E0_9HYPO|nr:[histone H3]-lysine79 N-trimethyltransferase [Geosmithia morbida]KAF4120361.1 [histone H3]-lysine79 N-trimethyltransferase [Geosmithia morbida]